MGFCGGRKIANLMYQPVVIYQRRDKVRVIINQTENHPQRGMRSASVKQAGNEDITCALVQDVKLMGVDEKKKLVVGFGEAASIAETVDNTANIKGIETVAMKANAIEEVKS